MLKKQKIAAVAAEFIGTYALASAVLAMVGRTNFPFFSAMAAGLTLTVVIMVLGPVSGAHINPAVTIGLWANRKIRTLPAIVYVLAQMLGGLAAWQLNQYLLNQTLKNSATVALDWRVFTAEAVGAFVFALAVGAAVYNNYESTRRAVIMGGGLAIGMLVASFGASGLINPALALGVRSWSASYVAGPIVGAVIGLGAYSILLAPRVIKSTATKTGRR